MSSSSHSHHHHRSNSIFKRIKNFLFPPRRNQYLVQHGFFDSFDEHKVSRAPERFPYLPYSLLDLLESRTIVDLNIFVAAHTSTAAWLSRRNDMVLGRKSRYHWHSKRVGMIADYTEYKGKPIDLLIWDSRHAPDDWKGFVDAHLAPRGVVILVYSSFHDAMEHGWGTVGEVLTARGMKTLEFCNPGPHTEVMTAELYYPQDNVLGI